MREGRRGRRETAGHDQGAGSGRGRRRVRRRRQASPPSPRISRAEQLFADAARGVISGCIQHGTRGRAVCRMKGTSVTLRAMADPAALSAAKNALRKIIRRQLSGLSEDYLASQSRDACDRLGRSAVFQASRSVAVFLSMPKLEIDTSGIIASIRSSGRECFVPRVVGTNRDDMSLVHLHPSERVDDFPRDRWLIPDPPMLYTHISGAGRLLSRPCIRPQAPGEALYGSGPASLPPLDLVLVPGLAFSPNGLRLGHGKGYYGESE